MFDSSSEVPTGQCPNRRLGTVCTGAAPAEGQALTVSPRGSPVWRQTRGLDPVGGRWRMRFHCSARLSPSAERPWTTRCPPAPQWAHRSTPHLGPRLRVGDHPSIGKGDSPRRRAGAALSGCSLKVRLEGIRFSTFRDEFGHLFRSVYLYPAPGYWRNRPCPAPGSTI
ncbi:hypothetical protein OPAG_00959 [Rhodococcus opacus PD630]|nr:hypothetical protein Pd630_LPD06591 [Rhodococcus opacus PD630]EHI40299.1 hypothetical protein OPAG_00959 [Rhodococcus opacus PD630]